uniref:sporulation protein Cse60 n=1 Tax=Thomasclavelia sp. TaxID=3025757 RepID=UPI0025D68D41|nr:sporulation protein Cse60 [Thomasclavelia sp.]
MKVKIIEKTHELDLEDEINDFLNDKDPKIISLHYQVAMTFSSELEYSFSCLIIYEDK